MFTITSSPGSTFVDLAVTQTVEGFFDLALDIDGDEIGDALVDDGLNSALIVSLFSDRRARSDEVANPLKRRGWIGDLIADVPGDTIGSGLWLYDQSRLRQLEAAGVAAEARNALQWMVDDGLVSSASVSVVASPATRGLQLLITLSLFNGSVSRHSFDLASATVRQLIRL